MTVLHIRKCNERGRSVLMKKLGIIGGLGPMATAYFLQLVTQMSDAQTDQEHIEIVLHSKPQLPDRTQYILGQSTQNPIPQMIKIGKELAAQGAELIAIPCITAHYFQRQLSEGISIPIINAIEEACLCLENAGISKVGIMATDGTIESKLFQKYFDAKNIQFIFPDNKKQRQVMHIIYENIKAGKPVDISLFHNIAMQLFDSGAQVVLLACTELSLIKRDYALGKNFLDVMETLARRSVITCGHLKKDYEHLI